jgi:hypothetical protein
MGKKVVDLTVPGWITSPENIAALTEQLEKEYCGENEILVLDLYGNLSYRFEQFDGTLSLPYKPKGRYLLAGKIVVCPLALSKRHVRTQLSFSHGKCQRVLSFLPCRATGCCLQADHCSDVGIKNHGKQLLTEVIGLRNALKRFFAGLDYTPGKYCCPN